MSETLDKMYAIQSDAVGMVLDNGKFVTPDSTDPVDLRLMINQLCKDNSKLKETVASLRTQVTTLASIERNRRQIRMIEAENDGLAVGLQ